MDLTRDTKLGELIDGAKFKPGDLVVHKAAPPSLASPFVVLCGYVPFAGSAVTSVGERSYFVRLVRPGLEPADAVYAIERFAESELTPLPDFSGPLQRIAERLRPQPRAQREAVPAPPPAEPPAATVDPATVS